MRVWILAILLAVGGLSGCATRAPGPRPPIVPKQTTFTPPIERREYSTGFPPTLEVAPTPPAIHGAVDFSDLEGWTRDDHAADFDAFVSSCPLARDIPTAIVCQRAIALGRLDESGARRFLETNFRPERLPDAGLLTAYYTPIYEARSRPGGEFTAPVRPRPADLPRRSNDAGLDRAYADRSQIEARPARDALAWMRPEDLFFLQIQGSGVLVFPNGPRLRAIYDGANGATFLGIAAPMRRQGLLLDQDTSAEKIRGWLSAHRGPDADAVMRLNPRYVFLRLQPDDGAEPSGAAGLRLPPGRALAVDPTKHTMGEAFWVDASSPSLSGAFPSYRRMAIALDSGSAIKGDVRADLYMGVGPEAGREAGRVRHVLHLFRLTPVIEAIP